MINEKFDNKSAESFDRFNLNKRLEQELDLWKFNESEMRAMRNQVAEMENQCLEKSELLRKSSYLQRAMNASIRIREARANRIIKEMADL